MSFTTIAAKNALPLVRVPGVTSTMPLLLVTNLVTIATTIGSDDDNGARVALLTAVVVRTLLLHFQKV